MNIFLKTLVLLPFLICIAQHAQAQPLPPDQVPIDPVSWVLLGGAAAIGGKKYYDLRKKKKTQENDL